MAHLDSLTKCFKNDDEIDLHTIQSLCHKICLNIFEITDKEMKICNRTFSDNVAHAQCALKFSYFWPKTDL